MPLTMVNPGEPNIIKKRRWKRRDKKVFGEPRALSTGGTVTVVSETGGNHDRECERFQSCHWKRYGK